MTTLRETFAADFEEEARLRESSEASKDKDDIKKQWEKLSKYKVITSMIKHNAQTQIKNVNKRNKRIMRDKANALYAMYMISNDKKYPRKRFSRS